MIGPPVERRRPKRYPGCYLLSGVCEVSRFSWVDFLSRRAWRATTTEDRPKAHATSSGRVVLLFDDSVGVLISMTLFTLQWHPASPLQNPGPDGSPIPARKDLYPLLHSGLSGRTKTLAPVRIQRTGVAISVRGLRPRSLKYMRALHRIPKRARYSRVKLGSASRGLRAYHPLESGGDPGELIRRDGQLRFWEHRYSARLPSRDRIWASGSYKHPPSRRELLDLNHPRTR